MLVPSLDSSLATTLNLKDFIYIGPTNSQPQSNVMLYSTRKTYSPKMTMLLFPVMFYLRGRRIKSSSTLRKIQKQMLNNPTNKSSKTQNYKTFKSPNHLTIPFHSLHLKNLNSRHQMA